MYMNDLVGKKLHFQNHCTFLLVMVLITMFSMLQKPSQAQNVIEFPIPQCKFVSVQKTEKLSDFIQLNIYPNPAQQALWIDCAKNVSSDKLGTQSYLQNDDKWEIININGQIIKSGRLENLCPATNYSNSIHTSQIDISSLTNGAYIFRLIHSSEIIHKKFMVQQLD